MNACVTGGGAQTQLAGRVYQLEKAASLPSLT